MSALGRSRAPASSVAWVPGNTAAGTESRSLCTELPSRSLLCDNLFHIVVLHRVLEEQEQMYSP